MQRSINLWGVLLKGLAIFLVFQIILLSSGIQWGGLIAYAGLGLLRSRFPISTKAPADAALDLGNLDTMFAAHIVSQPKASSEYRVFVLGDSAVWGIGFTPAQTLPGQLDALGLKCGGKDVRFYNLSFPRSSATKDLMILDKAMQYRPDLIIWMITWYTLEPKTRVDHYLVSQNPDEFYRLGSRFRFLPKNYRAPTLADRFYDQNRTLFHVLRFDLFSLINISTGVDQIPGPPEVLPAGLSKDPSFEGMKPPTLNISQVSLDQVGAFYQLAQNTPVVLVNQPMLVLGGVLNSDVRYNDYYPRWVYDQYRQYLAEAAAKNSWNYLDLWNIFSPGFFTDTPLHLSVEGEQQLALRLAPAIQKGCP
jgi:hypothetical protein